MRKMRKGANWFFLFIFWSALALYLCAVIARAERLPLKLYTSADGLASGAILHVSSDSRGFLWFATRAGLARFDGREFVNFRLENQTDSPTVNATFETRDGSFWIAASGGLYLAQTRAAATAVVQPKSDAESDEPFERFRAENVASFVPSAMFEDSRGRLWGGGGGAWLIAENGERRLQPFDLGAIAETERGIGIGAINETADGSVWFACNTGALRLLPDGRRILYPIKRQTGYDETRSVAADAAGRVWVGHSSGVFVFQPETIVALAGAADLSVRELSLEERKVRTSGALLTPVEPGKMLRLLFGGANDDDFAPRAGNRQIRGVDRLFESADGKIWIPAGGSLYVFDGKNIRRLSDANGFPGAVTAIAEDAENNLWITSDAGALRFNRRGMTTWGLVDGLASPRVHSIHEDKDGSSSLRVVHGDWLVSRLRESGEIETAQLDVGDGDRFLWTSTVAFPAAAGGGGERHWWALSSNGLYRYDEADDLSAGAAAKPSRIYGLADGFKSESFYAGFTDSGGNVWVSTRDVAEKNGLARLDAKTKEWKFFGSSADGFPGGASIKSFAEDAGGNLWFGGYGGGLFRYRNGRFDDFSKAAGAPRGGILALYVDRKNRLWIGSTRDGLGVVENTNAEELTFKIYTTEHGLTSNNIRAVTGDFAGDIYVGTISGVDRLDPETGGVRHYSTADGLASDHISAAFCDGAGHVWFGTLNGLSRLEPEAEFALTKTIGEPRVLLNDLRIAGKNYAVSEFGSEAINDLELTSAENNLRIEFLGVGGGLRYQYKLDERGGAAKDWSQPSQERVVNFAGLAPGAYQFSVRAVDSAGRGSQKPASISFSIAPPFWRTWEFIFLTIAIAAVAVFLLDRYRVAKTRQVETALVKSQTAEKATKESEARFRTLAETASDAIITIDEQSRIIFVNPAVEKVFGYNADELVGEKLTMLMPEKMRGFHDAGFGRYLQTNRKNLVWNGIELPGRHKSGAELPIEVSFGEFERDGRRYFTGIIRDISERRRAEEALRKAREERLTELQKVRTRIATDLHDDIGSSLTQISVLTEVARASAVLETVKSPLERISNVSNELVDAMADIVWAINPKKDSLRELVLRMRRFASDVLAAREIEFELDAPEDLDGVTLGANIRREVFAIFKESINNIVRHAEAGEVRINFAADENNLRLEIKDNGRGFDAREVLSDDFAPEKGGNGLINMRRRAAELGGTCEIESSASGTTTVLKIPLHSAQTGDGIHITQTGGAPIHTDSDGGGGNGLH